MTKKLERKWEIIGKSKKKITNPDQIIESLLINRGIKTKRQKDEFIFPKDPRKITLKEVGISKSSIARATRRIKKAKSDKESVIVYGDYDADGVCATAILWETLYSLGLNVMPHIPDRFSEGYGINAESVENLKSDNPDLKLIITVDNGVVAYEGAEKCKKLGIDLIITDHHEPEEKYPKAHTIIHSQKIGGAGISWILSREIATAFKKKPIDGLDLAAIGTVSDQIPLLGPNRSIVKFGLELLNNTQRPGLLALYKESGIDSDSNNRFFMSQRNVDTYSIGFIIAPRINAMGRLEHAIDSLRLLCTKNEKQAKKLALYLGKTNRKRQEIVEEVVRHARESAKESKSDSVIVISHETYHEGVIGLAAGKLVEEFYRPAIVFHKGGKHSKASARSVSGFDIIGAIRELDDMLLAAGGHPMAAGVEIKTKDLDKFNKRINKVAEKKLSKEMLSPKLKIDLEINFKYLDWDLIGRLKEFDPTGSGNPTPVFATRKVNPWDIRTVGPESKHLKMKVQKDGRTLDAIGFGLGWLARKLTDGQPVDIAYVFEENVFNGVKNMQLRLRDIRIQTSQPTSN